MKKVLLSFLFAFALTFAPAMDASKIRAPKGFDGKVYNAALALFATSEDAGITSPRFICTATPYQKINDGYLLISAGHCTPANAGLPSDMEFYVAHDVNESPVPVQLVMAKLADDESLDFSIFYLPTKEKYETVDLGDDSDLQIKDKTVDANFSLGAAKMLSLGEIVSTDNLNKAEGLPPGYFLVQEFDSHGASGSAVVSEKSHKIIGLVIAGWDGATMPSIVESIDQIKAELQKYNVKIGGKTHQLFVQKTISIDVVK